MDICRTQKTSRREPAFAVRRLLTAWFAVLGLLVQLSAAAACAAGGLSLDSSALSGAAPFPICHAHSADDPTTDHPGAPSPDHAHDCPFCSIHCHAAMVVAPSIAVTMPFVVVSVDADPIPSRTCPATRFRCSAAPRGPPARA